MGNSLSDDAPPPPNDQSSLPKVPPRPPPKVLVPPLFDSFPVSGRTRMLESHYNLLFGKLPMRSLFNDYFEEANHFTAKVMLNTVDDDPNANFIATVAGPLGHKPGEGSVGDVEFRLKRSVRRDDEDNLTFFDICVSNNEPTLLMRSSAYDSELGLGAFFILPVLMKERSSPGDYGALGFRCCSENISAGATVTSFYRDDEFPRSAWFVTRIGRVTAGVQYEPKFRSEGGAPQNDLADWSGAISYRSAAGTLLMPSFNFALELKNNSEFIASLYHHMVVQRRVRNPFEKNGAVGITNYIDFGFELQTRMDDGKSSNKSNDSAFQVAASWQANKNLLLKGKLGPLASSIALAFKSWWKPTLTFNVTAVRDHTKAETSYGFGIQVDSIRKASYQKANSSYVMLTPNMEHLAEGFQWNMDR